MPERALHRIRSALAYLHFETGLPRLACRIAIGVANQLDLSNRLAFRFETAHNQVGKRAHLGLFRCR